ncbi:MAG: ABC transporter substrate-binding protein [Bdellovibrionales bacterium]
MKRRNFLLLVLVQTAVLATGLWLWKQPDPRIKRGVQNSRSPDQLLIGYFHGGRTMMMYRAKIFGEFDRVGANVKLITKNLGGSTYFEMPDYLQNPDLDSRGVGKATGDELIELLVKGEVDGATIGETAFIKALREGHDIVAVAELGHDRKDGAGHVIALHNDVKLTDPKSFRGLKFGTRRSSGGDEVMLREFLLHSGVDPDKDVTIIPSISDDAYGLMLANREVDGLYAHVMGAQKWVRKYKFPVYLHRALDWVNPELSQSVLVFSKSVVASKPELVQKVVQGYVQRVHHEHTIPHHEKTKPDKKGLQINIDFEGLNLPGYRDTPTVRTALLNEWQDLLIKHKKLDQRVDIDHHVDNRFVENVKSTK